CPYWYFISFFLFDRIRNEMRLPERMPQAQRFAAIPSVFAGRLKERLGRCRDDKRGLVGKMFFDRDREPQRATAISVTHVVIGNQTASLPSRLADDSTCICQWIGATGKNLPASSLGNPAPEINIAEMIWRVLRVRHVNAWSVRSTPHPAPPHGI